MHGASMKIIIMCLKHSTVRKSCSFSYNARLYNRIAASTKYHVLTTAVWNVGLWSDVLYMEGAVVNCAAHWWAMIQHVQWTGRNTSLYLLHRRSPIWIIIHHMHLLRHCFPNILHDDPFWLPKTTTNPHIVAAIIYSFPIPGIQN